MTASDRQRWNNKWADFGPKVSRPDPLLVVNAELLTGGVAIDVACGQGKNSIWLAGLGYQVIGVDLSEVALRQAQATAVAAGVAAQIDFVQIDLDDWRPPTAVSDLIIVFRFLDRRLFPYLQAALKPGGLLVYETRHLGVLAASPQSDPRYLLEPGELLRQFAAWDIIYSAETKHNSKLIARKPQPD